MKNVEVLKTMTLKNNKFLYFVAYKSFINGINYPITNPKSTIKYSFRKKLKQPITSNMSAPGPDRYNIPKTITEDGRYPQSKFVNSRAPKISTSTGSRFKSFDSNTKNPAPGHYNSVANLHEKGIYPISKHKNS